MTMLPKTEIDLDLMADRINELVSALGPDTTDTILLYCPAAIKTLVDCYIALQPARYFSTAARVGAQYTATFNK